MFWRLGDESQYWIDSGFFVIHKIITNGSIHQEAKPGAFGKGNP